MIKKKDDFEKYLVEQLKDPEFKEEYMKLKPLYNLIEMEIKIRLEKKITQKELAKRMGTSQSAITRFERGNINPTLEFVSRLAKGLDAHLEIGLN